MLTRGEHSLQSFTSCPIILKDRAGEMSMLYNFRLHFVYSEHNELILSV